MKELKNVLIKSRAYTKSSMIFTFKNFRRKIHVKVMIFGIRMIDSNKAFLIKIKLLVKICS